MRDVLLGCMVLLTSLAVAQEDGLVRLKNTRQFKLESAFYQNAPFTIQVCLPVDYDSTKSYPAVYLLDADKSIGMAKDIGDWLMFRHEIRDIIRVGISYDKDDNTWWINRSRDFIPTQDTLSSFGKYWPKAGGADHFLDFVEVDLMPEIEIKFNIDTADGGIIGFSFGGLLVAYAMFTRPDMFKNYIIISPALVWDSSLIGQLESDFYMAGKALDKKVFVSISSEDSKELIIDPTRALVDSLKSRKYKGLELIYECYENETHFSGYPRALTTGLRRIYEM
jgi:predicted alpha/beta superfamily hydrolase